jgi:uncharacterized membrane protein YdjX (TVP38/TMEM64 family)
MTERPVDTRKRSLAAWGIALLALVLVVAVCAVAVDAAGLLDATLWADRAARLQAWQASSPVAFMAGFLMLFVLMSALAVPGCSALALLAGTAFGTLLGTLLVGLASTIGALLAFLAARYGARERVQRRLGDRLQGLDRLLARHGALALLGLRLVPVLPYPMLNPLLGLSRMSVGAFFWPSLAGLTLGSLPYVWAGQSLLAWWRGMPGHHLLVVAAAAGIVLLSTWWAHRRLRSVAA